MVKSYKLSQILRNLLAYFVLTLFAVVMLFPFLFMLFTSFKVPKDTFNYPPRLLPYEAQEIEVEGFEEPLPAYAVEVNGQMEEYVLVEKNIKAGIFADPADLDNSYTQPLTDAKPVLENGEPVMVTVDGESYPLFDVMVGDEIKQLVQTGATSLGAFANPNNLSQVVYQNVRLSKPVESVRFHPENYVDVLELQNMGRALTNTTLITLLVVLGQLVTSVVGGYAFARLRFPGRDSLFVFYLGTIMIPFVVLVIPLYQLMVMVGWVDRLAALIIPWVFTAYGTFLMRQFFVTVPRDIEEAALIDGASRFQILRKIFLPAAAPAIATLATFTFLYAWNSFFWPLVVINTGSSQNHVLTLALNILRGRAADAPNLVLAGAAISIIPPMLLFILGQRFFIESAMSSGVKG
jgi:multiple sugar transport system permease protein